MGFKLIYIKSIFVVNACFVITLHKIGLNNKIQVFSFCDYRLYIACHIAKYINHM